jgi:hypothetical protein
MALLTDYAVRRKGEEMAIRYCVMCLADGDKTPAVCVVELSDGTEAGYCKPCGETMVRTGHKLNPLPAENRKQWKGKLTDAQRREIAESGELAHKLAKRYGVNTQTIYNVRKKAKEEAQGGAPVADVEHLPCRRCGSRSDIARMFDPTLCAPCYNSRKSWEGVPTDRSIDAVIERNAPSELWPPIPIVDYAWNYADRKPNAFFDSLQPEDMIPAVDEPEPVSRNKEALSRVLEEESAPDAAIVFHITEAKADRIWSTSTLETKLAFARGELLGRLEAL